MAVLLTQEEATDLLELLKKCVSSSISLPKQGGREDISVVSTERESEKFIISVNRRNKRVNKVSYVARYKKGDVVLLRLDVGVTSPHVNPELLGGEILTGPHLHIYREGFEERYAIPFDIKNDDLITNFLAFLKRFNVLAPTKVVEQLPLTGV